MTCMRCELAADVEPDVAAEPDVAESPEVAGVRWVGPVAFENQPTGDGRQFMSGSITWADLPLPLRWVEQDVGGHDQAVVVGKILELERQGDTIVGRGVFDGGSPAGVEATRQVASGLTTGVSVDCDDLAFDEDGAQLLFTKARIRAVTLVALPAFAEARIGIDDGTGVPLVASAAGQAPPAAWFVDPQLTGPTPIRVGADGRIFGHAALWGTCHTGYAASCVTPPHSSAGYPYFRTGAVLCSDGSVVATGRITAATGHAGDGGADLAARHYDHTGLAVADVAAGEDEFGVWVAGAVRPGASAEQVRVVRASPLSGDWRSIRGRLELVGLLAVNVPGFPVVASASRADGVWHVTTASPRRMPESVVRLRAARLAEGVR